MFFKNAIVYQITQPATVFIDALREKIDQRQFEPCAPSQSKSFGFVPVGSEDGPLLLEQHNLAVIMIKVQERKIPAAGLREMVDDKVAEIEADQGRKVYRKERLSIIDELVATLLPKAVPVSEKICAYFDIKQNLVIVDAAAEAKAETVMSIIRETIGSFPVMIPQVKNDPKATMTNWLRQQAADPFSLGYSCELREPGESGAVHRIKDDDLLCESVSAILDEGKQVESIALSWQTDLRFTIHDPHKLKQLKFSNELVHNYDDDLELDADRFDADIALMAGVMGSMLPQIWNAFGGLYEQECMDLPAGAEKQ